MKKTFTAIVLALVLALASAMLLVGCGDTEPVHKTCYDLDADGICDVCKKDIEGHDHLFSKKWTTDETHHWHKATCGHSTEVGDKAEHTFKDSVCTVCKMFDMTPIAPVDGVYHFEAENAILNDGESAPSNATMVVEFGRHEFTESGKTDGPLVSDVGYFGGGATGQTITWKFNAKAAGEVKLTLRIASAVGSWSDRKISPIVLGSEGAPTLKVNSADVDLTGHTIEGLDNLTQEDMSSGVAYSHFVDIELTVNLVAGDNTVVLTSGSQGCNVDKIMVTTNIELAFSRTNNTDRPSSH